MGDKVSHNPARELLTIVQNTITMVTGKHLYSLDPIVANLKSAEIRAALLADEEQRERKRAARQICNELRQWGHNIPLVRMEHVLNKIDKANHEEKQND